MLPNHIKGELIKKGVPLQSIALELGVKPPAITRVINNQSASHRIRSRIAEHLGKKPEEIWPKSYDEGTPRKPGNPAFITNS